MKSSFFKYIFIVFVIGIVVSTIYFIYFREEEEKTEEIVESKDEYVDEKKDIRLRYIKL